MARAERIEEVTIRIDVNDARLCRTTASPEALDALAAGRLAGDGFITTAADVIAIATAEDPPGCHAVRVMIDPAAEASARASLEHIEQHGCGPLGLVTCLAPPRRHADAPPPPDPATIPALLRALTAAEQEERGMVGGMHGCGVVVAGTLRFTLFDIGRHSALDKALGRALLAGVPLHEVGVVTTARISGEMAAKAVRAGVAWLAGRSLATSLALVVADAAGLPIIVRAGSSAPHLHAPQGTADA
jgi:FdhD protein